MLKFSPGLSTTGIDDQYITLLTINTMPRWVRDASVYTRAGLGLGLVLENERWNSVGFRWRSNLAHHSRAARSGFESVAQGLIAVERLKIGRSIARPNLPHSEAEAHRRRPDNLAAAPGRRVPL